MKRVTRLIWTSGLLCLFAAGVHAQQYPMLDRAAAKVVQKYQTSSCQRLAAERAYPRTGQRAAAEQRIVRMLHEDPGMRREFLNRVAAPIANKLFECGLIP